MASLQEVSLELVDRKALARDQESCEDVWKNRDGQYPKSLTVENVEFSPRVLIHCENSNGKRARPLQPCNLVTSSYCNSRSTISGFSPCLHFVYKPSPFIPSVSFVKLKRQYLNIFMRKYTNILCNCKSKDCQEVCSGINKAEAKTGQIESTTQVLHDPTDKFFQRRGKPKAREVKRATQIRRGSKESTEAKALEENTVNNLQLESTQGHHLFMVFEAIAGPGRHKFVALQLDRERKRFLVIPEAQGRLRAIRARIWNHTQRQQTRGRHHPQLLNQQTNQ